MLRFICAVLLAALGLTEPAAAAAAPKDSGLITEEVTVVSEIDAFGLEAFYAEGLLINRGRAAYTAITLLAEVYDASGEVIGEGVGYPVNACLAGLLPDFVLLPGAAQPFAVRLELYSDGAEIHSVTLTPQATAIAAPPDETAPLPRGIVQIAAAEIVSVEWTAAAALRYAAGCWRDPFIAWSWYSHDLETGETVSITHPQAEQVTPRLLQRLNLTEPLIFNRAFLSFDPSPTGRRFVYQTALNKVVTAEPDGNFQRELFDNLADRTLQGIYWLANGRFLAYYYGAFNDPVLYFTADVNGQTLSERPERNPPSLIKPGASPDGTEIILAAAVDGVTGYYRKRAAYEGLTLLFEAEPPGNNWPSPVFVPVSRDEARVYAAVPVEGEARLLCFNTRSGALTDLAALPLKLASDERAQWWLAPDGRRLALAADGLNGGLWTLDLSAFRACR